MLVEKEGLAIEREDILVSTEMGLDTKVYKSQS